MEQLDKHFTIPSYMNIDCTEEDLILLSERIAYFCEGLKHFPDKYKLKVVD